MNRLLRRMVVILVATLIWVPPMLFAQQTSTMNGTVVDTNGDPLPGVVITLESPSLMGTRSGVTRESGSFIFRLLPPGDYTITATLGGMQTAKQTTVISVNQTSRPRIVLQASQEIEIIVTSDRVFELDTTAVASNFSNEFIEKLPRGRTMDAVARLAPGVTTGLFTGISVNGATASDNKYLLNGVMVNADNIRGTGQNLFIQDNIQETQVLTGNVSAEFGGFAGGIVNTITKSGGNAYSGIFRTALRRNDWTARTPIQLNNNDELGSDLDKVYTLTFNGPIVKDRLWFSLSGRNFDNEAVNNFTSGSAMTDAEATALGLPTGQTAPGGRVFNSPTQRDRYQLKLTGQIHENHTVVASYLDDDLTTINRPDFSVLDLQGTTPQYTQPSTLLSVNYRGILTPSMTLDLTYGDRSLELNSGLVTNDLVAGTVIRHRDQSGNPYSNSPFGDGSLADTRESANWTAKFSYFLDQGSTGSHDFVFGVEEVKEERETNNAQSANGFQLWTRWTRFDGDRPIPVFTPGGTGNATWIVYWPIVNASQGNEFATRSAFLNDVWTLNEKWYFNIGIRYDENETKAEDGQELSNDDKFSPRLSANYDVFGDGRHQFSGGFNKYVAKLNNAAQSGSVAGAPALFAWRYQGQQTEDIQVVYDWIDANFQGGIAAIQALDPNALNNQHLFSRRFSPDTSPENLAIRVQDGGLASAGVTEFTFGYKHNLRNRGFVKADLVVREYDDFLVGRIDTTTGVTPANVDRQILYNDDENYSRDYKGLLISGQYTLNENWLLGGNYTLSEAEGNINGVTSGAGSIVTTRTTTYPEYNTPFANPVGRLPEDSTHNLRLWASYDLNTQFGNFSFTGLHTFNSGQPYGISANLDIQGRETQFGFPDPSTLPYQTPPTGSTYWVTTPDAFEFDDLHATDIAVNYDFPFAKRFEFFTQISVFNVFNNQAQLAGNVADIDTTGRTPFNVFTETPQEGVHYDLGSNFGKATTNGHYQAGRTLTIDFGLRF